MGFDVKQSRLAVIFCHSNTSSNRKAEGVSQEESDQNHPHNNQGKLKLRS